jgi:hypothetical protein
MSQLITSGLAGELAKIKEELNSGVRDDVSSVLPLLFRLKGQPYSLDWSHFMFKPMFKIKNAPRRMLWRTARQVSKSTSQAASQIILARLIPYFNILTVLPRAEQARVFSSNSVGPFIKESPVKKFLMPDTGGTDSVFQRDIGTSILYYGYSFNGADRLRGRACSCTIYDESQDLDITDIPIIQACLAASAYKLERFTGTPKTFDNLIEVEWEKSSQGVWHIPCLNTGCKHINRCQGDNLEKMVGPETLICGKCGKPVNSRLGYYIHDFPDRVGYYEGYHVSQPILPMHYESKSGWKALLDFRKERPAYAWKNEVLGESFDSGTKLVTKEELAAACIAEAATPDNFPCGKYTMITTGTDWGGRGKEKTTDTDDFISNTAMAVAGIRPDGVIEIPWLYRVPYNINHIEETKMVGLVANRCRASWSAMDYGGQGNVMEELVVAGGMPRERIVPFTYCVMGTNKPIVFYQPPQHFGVRSSYMLDKPRSLLLLCELIKHKLVVFGKNDEYLNNHLTDFLSIYEEATDSPRGSSSRLVKRLSRRTDDVVHAVNFAVMALYHATSAWPKLAQSFIDEKR